MTSANSTDLSDEALLRFTKRVHQLESFGALVEAVREEVERAVGYRTSWIASANEERTMLRVIASGLGGEVDWRATPEVPVAGDPYVERMMQTLQTAIVEDCQVDPNVNREMVTALGNRTVVNVPLVLINAPVGFLGTGTFGDEGVKLPTDAELDYLERLCPQLAVALARLVLAEERRQAHEREVVLQRALAERQRFESIGALAGGIAHDFNNLLTVIRAGAATLNTGTLDEGERGEELKLIDDAAVRAAELTMRLLAMGKRQPLDVHSVSVTDAVASVATMVRRVVPASLEVDVIDAAKLPHVLADRTQLEQVLLNLALNARDAMPGGGRLTVETEHVTINGAFRREHPWAKPGRYVLISVTDTGTGMDAATQERIFEPFFTTKEGSGGSGLGLAVSRGIVEQHGGMMHVYSEVGVGTTFKVYLPVADRAAIDVGTKLHIPSRGAGEKILIADDQPHVRNALQRVLQRSGYEVRIVADGEQALEAIAEERPDLVILDAVMPGLGGRETFNRLKSAWPRLPVLFVSGYGAEELTARFLADLDVSVLPKPFAPDELLVKLRKLLDPPAAP